MGTRHLIMGVLEDYLTGQTLPDTHDERIIQKISQFLIEDKGYLKNDVLTRKKMSLTLDGKTGTVTVNFIIQIDQISFAVIMYGPGSIVTRQRPTIAVARLFEDYMIPFSMITNGEEADLMDTKTGKVIGKGLDSIPSHKQALTLLKDIQLETLTRERREKEQRILYTMDILTEAECKDFTCQT